MGTSASIESSEGHSSTISLNPSQHHLETVIDMGTSASIESSEGHSSTISLNPSQHHLETVIDMGTSASIESSEGHSSTINLNPSLQTMENATTSQADLTQHSADGEKEGTNEEKETWKEKIFNDLNESINKIKQIPRLQAADGNWNGDLLTSLSAISDIYHEIQNIGRLQYVRKYQREAGQRLSESATSIMCKVIMDGWLRGYINENTTNTEYQGIKKSLDILLGYSDCTPEVTYDIAGQPDFLETLKLILTTFLPKHMKGETQEEDEKVIYNCLGIFHNISMMDQNIPRLRSLEIVPVLDSFLDAKIQMHHLMAFTTLANIIDEQECAILRDKPDVVVFLLKTLESAIQSKMHREKGWSALECAVAVRRIARNDANKKILVRLGCLKQLVKLVQSEDVEEKREAVGAILVLAFERGNHSRIVDDKELKIIDWLNGFKGKDEDNEIREAIKRIFWILREELQKHDRYKDIVSSFEQKNRPVSAAKQPGKRSGATVKNEKGHIMISYSWDQQTEIKKITSFLKGYYKVWVDTENMQGSTLEAMANGVEGAHVVLICMSQKYKDSSNCRLEAEYAHKLNKNIIPLKMESRYEPDGWLGILIGTQLFYEFSGKYPFDAKLKDLIRGINHCYENEDVKPRGVAMKSPLEKTVAVIREWTPDRVNKWIEDQKLPKDNFQEFTSRELALLVTMRSEAPVFVYNCLQTNLGINSLKTMAMFIEGLEDLLSKDVQDLSA